MPWILYVVGAASCEFGTACSRAAWLMRYLVGAAKQANQLDDCLHVLERGLGCAELAGPRGCVRFARRRGDHLVPDHVLPQPQQHVITLFSACVRGLPTYLPTYLLVNVVLVCASILPSLLFSICVCVFLYGARVCVWIYWHLSI